MKNQLKELHQKDNKTLFTYDSQGNTIKEESNLGINSFEYNTINQQVKAITKEGNTLVSRYDAEGLRYEIEENEKLTKFIFHKENVLVETDKDYNSISRFTRGYEVVAAEITTNAEENRYYYTQDEQGSTTFIIARDQSVKNEYCYDAFGNILEAQEEVHNRITYTGQQFDGITNQYYLRARFYNPIIGRFTQEDVYRGDGLNLYAYCGNNPVGYYDPSGYANCKSKTSAHNEGNDTDYSSISAYKGIDVEKIPIEYRADPRLTTQMDFKGKGKGSTNAAGWERNANKHFNELLDNNPEYWSKKNTTRIEDGLVPIVDKKFIEHFPQYKDNVDDKLIHHYIGGGGQATAVPESLHKGFGGIHNIEKEIGIRNNDSLTDVAEALAKDYKK